MPGNRRDKYFRKFVVEYIDEGVASCSWNRRVKYLYKVCCEIY
jgi:hypothetical protein